jgi:hypothetical protein
MVRLVLSLSLISLRIPVSGPEGIVILATGRPQLEVSDWGEDGVLANAAFTPLTLGRSLDSEDGSDIEELNEKPSNM